MLDTRKAPVLYTGKGWSALAIALMVALALALFAIPVMTRNAADTARLAESNRRDAAIEQQLVTEIQKSYRSRRAALALKIGNEQFAAVVKYGQVSSAGRTPEAVGEYVLTHKLRILKDGWAMFPPDTPPLVGSRMASQRLTLVYARKFPGEVTDAELTQLAAAMPPTPHFQ